MPRWPLFSLLCLVSVLPDTARAHLDLIAPTSRYGPDVLKTGPCGVAGGERSENITRFEPGESIEVRWEEYIDHPAHYRIAFDADGDDDFVDPSSMMELYSNDAVLLDGIADEGRDQSSYSVTVTLPDVTCSNCTLQVIQVMYDKPPYTTPGNDVYYQCADLVLCEGCSGSETEPDAGTDPDAGSGPDAGAEPGSDGGGCNASQGNAAGSWLMSLIFFLGACRLARRPGLPV